MDEASAANNKIAQDDQGCQGQDRGQARVSLFRSKGEPAVSGLAGAMGDSESYPMLQSRLAFSFGGYRG